MRNLALFFMCCFFFKASIACNKSDLLLLTKKNRSYYNIKFNYKLREILNHEDGRVIMTYIYPFFSSDDNFFKFLIDYPTWQASQVLYNIANDRFPNGIPNDFGINKLNMLLNKINSHKLEHKISLIIEEEKNRASSTKANFEVSDFSFEEIQDPIALADNLNRHQRSIILSVKIVDFYNWFHSKKPPQVLTDIVNDHAKIIKFFSNFLENETNVQTRQERLDKLIIIFNRLMSHNNLWGASQINDLTNMNGTNLEDHCVDSNKYLLNIYDIISNIKNILIDINSTFYSNPDDFDKERFILLGKYIKMFITCQYLSANYERQ